MTSFNLTWKNDTKSFGKVFARKHKAITGSKTFKLSQQNSNNINDLPVNIPDKKIEKHLGMKQKVIKIKNNSKKEKQSPVEFNDIPAVANISKLVKRKQKKDKLLAKLAADSQQKSLQPSKPKDHSLFSVGNKNIYIKSNTKGKSVIEEVFSDGKKFVNLDIHKYIVSNLEKIGFTTLTNVQVKSIPVILAGKNVLVSKYD